MTGIDGVRCACQRLLPPSCTGLLIPSRVGVLATKACSLFDKATEARSQVRRLKRGARLLRRAAIVVGRAGSEDRLARDCAAALEQWLNEARERAERLAGVR
jgi:hypothetical protein